MPVKGALPPLFLAVLHRHKKNVQLLLDAQADPWQEIAIASVLCHSLQWHGHAARKEVFNAVQAVQAAAAQSAEDTVLDMLQQFINATEGVGRGTILPGTSEAYSSYREGHHYHEANCLEISTYHRKAVTTDKLYYVPMAQNTRRIVFTSTNTQ